MPGPTDNREPNRTNRGPNSSNQDRGRPANKDGSRPANFEQGRPANQDGGRPANPYPRRHVERMERFDRPRGPMRHENASPNDPDATPQQAIGGFEAVEERLQNRPETVHRVLFRLNSGEPKLYSLQKLAKQQKVHVQQLERKVLDEIFRPNGGVVALLHERAVLKWEDVRADLFAAAEQSQKRTVAALTNIEDPRNLGACIRSALALNAHTLLMPSKGMCGLTPAVARSSAGALDKLVPCRPDNLEGALTELSLAGYTLVGLDGEGDRSLVGYEFPDRVIICVGGEDHGLPPFVRKQCHAILRIPMNTEAHSFNASVALSLALYERNRSIPS